MDFQDAVSIPCLFEECCPSGYEGSLVYFHPGGLQAKLVNPLKEAFPNWQIFRVEMMMCMPYMESISKKGELVGSIDQIGESLFTQIHAMCGRKEKVVFIGWSFGGVVAFDVASRWLNPLKPDLVFIDSIAPISSQSFSDKNIASKQTLKWFWQYLQSLKNCSLNLNLALTGKIDGDNVLEDLLDQCKSQGAFDKETKFVSFKKIFTSFIQGLMRNSRLTAGYQAKFYDGNLLLIRAKQGLLLRFKWIHHMGWKNLVSGLTIKPLNYDHYQVINDANAISQIVELSAKHIQFKKSITKNSIYEEVAR